MQIRVDCYAGYRGEETPRIIGFQSPVIKLRLYRCGIAGWPRITVISKSWASMMQPISFEMIVYPGNGNWCFIRMQTLMGQAMVKLDKVKIFMNNSGNNSFQPPWYLRSGDGHGPGLVFPGVDLR